MTEAELHIDLTVAAGRNRNICRRGWFCPRDVLRQRHRVGLIKSRRKSATPRICASEPRLASPHATEKIHDKSQASWRRCRGSFIGAGEPGNGAAGDHQSRLLRAVLSERQLPEYTDPTIPIPATISAVPPIGPARARMTGTTTAGITVGTITTPGTTMAGTAAMIQVLARRCCCRRCRWRGRRQPAPPSARPAPLPQRRSPAIPMPLQ